MSDNNSVNLSIYDRFYYEMKENEKSNPDLAMEQLYHYVEQLIDKEKYVEIDIVIDALIQLNFKLVMLIGMLTITHPIQESIKFRKKLLDHVKIVASNNGLSQEKISYILKGFE